MKPKPKKLFDVDEIERARQREGWAKALREIEKIPLPILWRLFVVKRKKRDDRGTN